MKSKDALYVTAEECAALYSVSAPTVRKWLRDGTIPGQLIGRTWIVDLNKLPEQVTTRKGNWTLRRGDAV